MSGYFVRDGIDGSEGGVKYDIRTACDKILSANTATLLGMSPANRPQLSLYSLQIPLLQVHNQNVSHQKVPHQTVSHEQEVIFTTHDLLLQARVLGQCEGNSQQRV